MNWDMVKVQFDWEEINGKHLEIITTNVKDGEKVYKMVCGVCELSHNIYVLHFEKVK